MAVLRYSSPDTTGTSTTFDSTTATAITKNASSRSIFAITTTPTTTNTSTTTTQPATTKPTANSTANSTATATATATNRKPTTQPTSTSSPSSTTAPPRSATTLLGHLRPLLSTTLKTLYHTHRLLLSLVFSTLTLILLQSLTLLTSLAQLLFLSSSFATKLVLYRSLILFRQAIMETASLTWNIWDSRKARQIRKKIEFEFFAWILGPGGNLLCFLLWPGWLVLGLMVWAVSCALSGVSITTVSG